MHRLLLLALLCAAHAAAAGHDAGGGAGEEEADVLEIVPRAVWDPGGVAGGDRYPSSPAATYTRIVVHHSDFLEPAGALGIKTYHLEVSGFSDIGYHYVIAPDGVVSEGRPLDRMGAHAGATREGSRGDKRNDPDWGAVGIVLDGSFMEELPPEPQRAALHELITHLRARLPKVRDVIGHREVRRTVLARGHHPTSDVTTCPGDALFGWLERERTSRPSTHFTDDVDPPPPKPGGAQMKLNFKKRDFIWAHPKLGERVNVIHEACEGAGNRVTRNFTQARAARRPSRPAWRAAPTASSRSARPRR